MTLKIIEILEIKPYTIVCRFNNGQLKQLDVLHLIQEQSHLHGINQLLDEGTFRKVKIGKMGELVWKKIISNSIGDYKQKLWDYDISPDFVFHNSPDLLQ